MSKSRNISERTWYKMSTHERATYTGIVRYGLRAGAECDVNFKDGKYHKELGPATVFPSSHGGTEYFWLKGVSYTEKEYWRIMLKKYEDTDKEGLVFAKILGCVK